MPRDTDAAPPPTPAEWWGTDDPVVWLRAMSEDGFRTPTKISEQVARIVADQIEAGRKRSHIKVVDPLCERCEAWPAKATVLDDGEPVDLCSVCAPHPPRNEALHQMVESGNRLWAAIKDQANDD